MEEPVKVLEMIACLNYGGSQAMIVNLCKAMNRKNVQCDFIVDHPEYSGMEEGPSGDPLAKQIRKESVG